MNNARLFGILLTLISLWLIYYFYDWKLMVILFFLISGNNIEQQNK